MVNAMSESNGTSTELSLQTIPTVTTRDGEMIWTSPNGATAILDAGTATNPDTRTNSVAYVHPLFRVDTVSCILL